MAASSESSANIEARLRPMVLGLLEQATGKAPAATAIPGGATLSELGLTSIDFLDFVMAVEKEFQLEILDTISPDELPTTLDGWRQYVASRLPESK